METHNLDRKLSLKQTHGPLLSLLNACRIWNPMPIGVDVQGKSYSPESRPNIASFDPWQHVLPLFELLDVKVED